MRTLLLLALLLPAVAARAATLTGADYAGADLLPANGDVLSGVFTNVRFFSIASGATVYVAVGVPLSVYASTVSLQGTLDASGRGQPGGGGGATAGAGSGGFGGGPSGAGAGIGGASLRGGGGGAHGGAGGSGGGGAGAAGGTVYDSTGTFTAPLSADDVFQGSGGGGGGGGSLTPGVAGASGGGAVYVEASSMTVTGSILLQGATAAAGIASVGTNPGGGGGGAGGGLLLRVTGPLLMSGTRVTANGGGGGNVIDLASGNIDPGGGGSGGRIKIFTNARTLASVTLSTAGGSAGGAGGFTGVTVAPVPTAGAAGTVSFGTIASSPTAFAAQTVYITSISWAWNAVSAFGDAPAASQAYRIFPATTTAPFASPELAVSSLLPGATIAGLAPNTTYFRFVTAYTDWGDSFPSTSVSTHTLAALPAAAAAPFTGMSATSLTANWTSGAPANPAYTSYELQSALDSGFSSSLATSFVVGLSSSPAGLTPNTTYYFRARAVNLDGVPTDYTATLATATLAAVPGGPVVGPVHVSSAVFTWSAGNNPAATQYEAQVSSDNFFSLTGSSAPLSASATFFGLTPNIQYFFRVRAVNLNAVPSDYTASVSTRSGVLSDVTPPSAPGTPITDRAFSYDGNVLFLWGAAQSTVGILDYELLVGSYPGGNDVFNGRVPVSSYTATGLATGRTYYAQVRARSNAGTVGPFSGVSVGVPVFKTSEVAAIAKPYSWPNPFDPARGPAQIGFSLDAPADVVMRVYTLQGRPLRETTTRYSSAGNQILTWDGRDDSGVRVAPGGYVVLLSKRYAGRTDNQKLKVAVLY